MAVMTLIAPAVVQLPTEQIRSGGELGGKGGALDRMLSAGLPVPATAVVTAAAYREFAADAGIRAVIGFARDGAASVDVVDSAFLAAPLADSIADEIVAIAGEIGGGSTIAVRSSADAEDMAGLSFAGQYRSALHIDSSDRAAVLRAVRLTWASLWHPAPVAYRHAWAIPDADAVMSVVLMRMVHARMAGVTFTLDPAGDAPQMRVEAVTGLADGLVSGERTPQVWSLPRDPAATTPTDPSLPLRELAALGWRAERLFGGPQDIEWAWDGRRVWLVQSRPITTTASGDGCDSPVGSAELISTGVDEMLPGVLPPLVWDLNAFLVEEALRRVFDDVGINPAQRAEANVILRRVRGRAALDLDLFTEVAASLPGVSTQDLEHEYFGTPVDAGGVPSRRGRWSIGRDLRVSAARWRAVAETETVLVAAGKLADAEVALTCLDDNSLLAYRQRLIDFGARAMAAELAVAAAAAAAYRRVDRFLARYLEDDAAAQATQVLTAGAGIAMPSSARSSRSVFAGPTWAEAAVTPAPAAELSWPDRLIDRQRMRVGIEQRLQRHRRWRRIRLLTGQIIDVQLRNLRASVTDTTTSLARRDRVKAAVLAVGGLVRQIHLELGRRLRERGVLDTADDVDLLRDAELRAAVGGHGPPPGTLALRRRWQERYEDAGPLPQRFTGTPAETPAPAPDGQVMDGWAASGGRHSGRARVMDQPRAGELNSGEVLVARATDAAWTPVFLKAGAIVVERGGPLSHAAVVARELGVPAVLNVAGAASHLDGQIITVDGDRGQVVVHHNEDGEQHDLANAA